LGVIPDRFRRYLWAPVALAVLLAVVTLLGSLPRLSDAPAASARARRDHATRPVGSHWVADWRASQQPATASNLSTAGFQDQTLREIVFSGTGGSMVRARFSNRFGVLPLHIGSATVAVQLAGAQLAADTVRALTFRGRDGVVIPPGASVVSDPVTLTVAPLTHLAVSLALIGPTGPATQHARGAELDYISSGNHTDTPSPTPFAATVRSWDFLAGVDVLGAATVRGTVVTFGDSITDGVGSPVGADLRWPDDLARRFATRRGPTLSVVDDGISGNRVLNGSPCCGPAAVVRFSGELERTPGARAVILLEGINDIGYSRLRGPNTAPHTAVTAAQIIAGYKRIIAAAHARRVAIFGGTLLPFRGARYWSLAGELVREQVNAWIRASGAFDGVIDFARALADPGDPLRLRPAYDSGDHLHPDAAGYRAMARAVDLVALLRAAR
jgi:lysophospholipase L1-like esterase